MAKGDVIIGKFAAAGQFQPAAGIEVIMVSVSNTPADANSNWAFYDGAVAGYFSQVPACGVTLAAAAKVRVPITNAIYLHCAQSGTYSGIQVK